MMIYVMQQSKEQGEAFSKALRWLADKQIHRVHCSPLVATEAISETISAALNLPLTVDVGLREINFGSISDDLWRQGIFERWVQGEADAAFTGGEHFNEAYFRFAGALARVPADMPALLISHSAIVHSILPYLCVNAAALQVRDPLEAGAFVVLERYDADRYICRSWNLAEHLADT